ncbi:MAG: carboxypeptidase-like regulatory domain-containing protein [Bacteroidia bacterium]|nr:carboxypeptidase-like regulatory domain-containing protein [Bacteroidia bacterium]
MKKNLFKLIPLLILILSIGISGCNRAIDDKNTVVLPDPDNAVMKINLVGKVLDDNQQPVANATARIGNKTVQTNDDGYFIVKNVEMKGPYGYVKVEKNGFFNGSRTFKMQSGETYVYIQLLPKTARGTISGVSGGSVSFDGFTVTLPAYAVKKENGAPYTGTVTVLGQYLNPNDPNLSLIMPGDLVSKNQYNVPELIKTYGMVGVELVGSMGEPLQITPGQEAIVEFPVQSNQLSGAPTEIPLWHFDETNGFWMREGSATIQNGKYIGKVKHFSFWNCDTPEAANINLEMTLVDASGNPLPNLFVTLTSVNYGTRAGFTNATGWVGGLIPNNEVLVMEVSMPLQNTNCQLMVQNIGPFTVNTNLGNVVITASGAVVVTSITGIVQDCNMLPVANGAVMMSSANSNAYDITDANGSYTFSHITCIPGGVNADFFAQDFSNFVQGPTSTILLNGGSITQNLSACGVTIAEYISHTENGTNFMFTNPLNISCVDSASGGNPALQVYVDNFGGGSQQQLNFNIEDTGGGTYNVTYFIGYGFTGLQTSQYTITNVSVTNFPTLTGQYLDCVISGTFTSPPNGPLPFNTTVHILKD